MNSFFISENPSSFFWEEALSSSFLALDKSPFKAVFDKELHVYYFGDAHSNELVYADWRARQDSPPNGPHAIISSPLFSQERHSLFSSDGLGLPFQSAGDAERWIETLVKHGFSPNEARTSIILHEVGHIVHARRFNTKESFLFLDETSHESRTLVGSFFRRRLNDVSSMLMESFADVFSCLAMGDGDGERTARLLRIVSAAREELLANEDPLHPSYDTTRTLTRAAMDFEFECPRFSSEPEALAFVASRAFEGTCERMSKSFFDESDPFFSLSWAAALEEFEEPDVPHFKILFDLKKSLSALPFIDFPESELRSCTKKQMMALRFAADLYPSGSWENPSDNFRTIRAGATISGGMTRSGI